MLDIAILDDSGRPAFVRGLGTAEHEALIQLAETRGASYLLRFRDYYGDATIDVYELGGFRDELRRLLDSSPAAAIAEVARALDELAVKAQAEGKKIVAIAD